VIQPVAKAIDAQRSRVFTRHHAGPGGNGDRRDAALQWAVHAVLQKALDGGQMVQPAIEHEPRGKAIKADNQNPLFLRGHVSAVLFFFIPLA